MFMNLISIYLTSLAFFHPYFLTCFFVCECEQTPRKKAAVKQLIEYMYNN